jgi:inner membrane protein
MHREGHLGIGFSIVAVAVFTLGPLHGGVFGAAALLTTSLPDGDLHWPIVSHRGITHTIWFAIFVGGGFGALTYAGAGVAEQYLSTLQFDVSPLLMVIRERVLISVLLSTGAAAGIIGHILGDMLTVGGYGNDIKPFSPVLSWSHQLRLCKADSPWWNYGLLVAGGALLVGTLRTSAALPAFPV